MLHPLYLQTKTNHKYKLTYDTVNNVLLKDDGRLLNINLNIRDKINTSFGIEVVLGFDCNMSCKYCNQYESKKVKNIENIDYDLLINKLHTYIDSNCFNNKVNVRNGDPATLIFWGGEPLLYFNAIKNIVKLLRQQYPHLKVIFSSNGLLFKDEIFEYIKSNNIMIGISHDGLGQEIRGIDPFKIDDIRRNIEWMLHTQPCNIRFHPTIHKFNKFHVDVVNYFKNIFSIDNFKLNDTKYIRPKSEEILNNVALSRSELLNSMHSLSTSLILNEIPQYNYAYEQANNWLFNLGKPTQLRFPMNDAKINENVCINLNGDLLQCHSLDSELTYDNNELVTYGNLFKNDFNTIQRPIPKDVTEMYQSKCINCLVYNCNDRGCAFRQPYIEYNCLATQVRIASYITLALYKITDDIVYGIGEGYYE